jgi:hypothetical protein
MLALLAPLACNAITGLDIDYRVKSDAGDSAVDPDRDSSRGETTDARFCVRMGKGAEFCEDFEQGDAGSFSAESIIDNAAGSFALVDGAGLGGSRGLDVTMTQLGGGSTHAWLAAQLAGAPTDFSQHVLEFDFQEVGDTTFTYVAVGALTFLANQSQYGVVLLEHDFMGRGPPRVPDPPKVPSNNSWHHAKVELKRSGGDAPYVLTVQIEGTIVDSDASIVLPSNNVSEVRIGAFSTTENPGANVHMRFDNVIVRRVR